MEVLINHYNIKDATAFESWLLLCCLSLAFSSSVVHVLRKNSVLWGVKPSLFNNARKKTYCITYWGKRLPVVNNHSQINLLLTFYLYFLPFTIYHFKKLWNLYISTCHYLIFLYSNKILVAPPNYNFDIRKY